MTAGALLAAAAFALATRIGPDARWLTDLAPSALLLGLGLCCAVAPLTATVLAAAPEQLSGAASGVNNAVARTAGLLSVAVIPSVAGLSTRDRRRPLRPAARLPDRDADRRGRAARRGRR